METADYGSTAAACGRQPAGTAVTPGGTGCADLLLHC